jgi:hypothetical protein
MAGLDPAIHFLRKIFAKGMDARVKPAHDEWYVRYGPRLCSAPLREVLCAALRPGYEA